MVKKRFHNTIGKLQRAKLNRSVVRILTSHFGFVLLFSDALSVFPFFSGAFVPFSVNIHTSEGWRYLAEILFLSYYLLVALFLACWLCYTVGSVSSFICMFKLWNNYSLRWFSSFSCILKLKSICTRDSLAFRNNSQNVHYYYDIISNGVLKIRRLKNSF